MTYLILLGIGLSLMWLSRKTTEEVHCLALRFISSICLSWGYLTSPPLVQWLSGILILGAYQIYISTVES
jgi:hypothetical protein